MSTLLGFVAVTVIVTVVLDAAPAIGQDAGTDAMAGEHAPTVETHLVEPGDTLWDLSQRIMGSPWLWPKVWSFNPEISNPHWIYPGDVVRFYPSQQELPTQAELIADAREIPPERVDEEIEDIEEPAPASIEVVETARRAPRRAANTWRRVVNLFVTAKELAEAGTLTNSVENRLMLAARDQVFLTFPGEKPKPGQRFMVYRTLGEVYHPVEKKRWGYMTEVTGIASIEQVGSVVTRARLVRTMVEVERGQYVGPLDQALMLDIHRRPADKPIEGVVLAVNYDVGEIAGEHQIVFVDKGTNDGLERGNELNILRKGDPLTGRTEDMPERVVGRLLVIQANANASTCLITNSTYEVEAGVKVVAVTY